MKVKVIVYRSVLPMSLSLYIFFLLSRQWNQPRLPSRKYLLILFSALFIGALYLLRTTVRKITNF
jgi:hypothetical protein